MRPFALPRCHRLPFRSLWLALLLPPLLLLFAAVPPAACLDRHTPVVEAVAKAGPAVVNIRTEQIVQRRATPFFGFSDPFFQQFFRDFGATRTFKTQALGSGVIIDPRGYVLTNAHVIDKASRIFVALPDQRRELEASLIGKAPRVDLAVIKINASGTYPALAPARSDDLLLGETVIAIGNPLGLGHSVTTGIVSAALRRVEIDAKHTSYFIQTDALINPGNSGGPLLNINGDLIGINTAIIRQAQGIGFSIPIDVAKRILPALLAHGKVPRAFTGLTVDGLAKQETDDLGGGVLVQRVAPNSPAAQAGLRFGDVLTAMDGADLDSPVDFYSQLETYVPGNTVNLRVLRGFDTLRRTVTLATLPANYALDYAAATFGFSVEERGGLVAVAAVTPGGPADKIGIHAGDLVAEVEDEKVNSLKDYDALMVAKLGQTPLRFLIVRGRRGYYVNLP